MTDSQTLKIALKEWAVVCRALERGRQILLLRKGGIYEAAGEFELEHRRFLLFPTYLHQKIEMLKTGERDGFEARQHEPQQRHGRGDGYCAGSIKSANGCLGRPAYLDFTADRYAI